MLACIRNHYKVAQHLLQHGANPNFINAITNETALSNACNVSNKKLVTELIAYGGDVDNIGDCLTTLKINAKTIKKRYPGDLKLDLVESQR